MIIKYALWDYTAKPWLGTMKFLCGINERTPCCDEIEKMYGNYLDFKVDQDIGLPIYKIAIEHEYYGDSCDHVWLPAKFCPFCGAPLTAIQTSKIVVTSEIKETPRVITVPTGYVEKTVIDRTETKMAREYDNDGKLIREWVPT